MEQIENDLVKVILSDDHKIIRDGIRAMLKEEKTIAIVGEAASGDELISLLSRTVADVVLLDINMPGRSGFEVAADLRTQFPEVKILFLSMLDNERYAFKAIESGATGYLVKDAGKDELTSALHLVAKGITYISPSI
ncbi:response regulator transcription factor [Pontibacter sp. SGAir0037]|uniref:response regulator n=1 Tax=Pontibacter sp. SGAir0037 TaxID=2571030 RepID=UPI001F0D318E|nr:response regulator transcription factor [Pontibacter sp. SGAir0037]